MITAVLSVEVGLGGRCKGEGDCDVRKECEGHLG